MAKGATVDVSALSADEKLAIFREMQREQRVAAEEKAAGKAGQTLEEYRATRGDAAREARYARIAKEEGITVEEVRARAGTRRSANGERKTLVSVTVPVSLAPDKQLERIERSIKSLEAAREKVLAENPDLAA